MLSTGWVLVQFLVHNRCSLNKYLFNVWVKQMWELDHKEGRATKNRCFWTIVLEKTLESPSDSKEIKPVNLTENQCWALIWRTDAEAPILWPPDSNSRLTGKDPDAGQGWKQKEKGTTEDEAARWHHRCNGHERGQPLEMARDTEPGVRQIMGSQRRKHNWTTEQQNGCVVSEWIYFMSSAPISLPIFCVWKPMVYFLFERKHLSHVLGTGLSFLRWDPKSSLQLEFKNWGKVYRVIF